MALVAVCHDLDLARLLVAHGVHVVVCGVAAEELAGAIQGLAEGAGRLAVFAGDPADPDVRAAAGAMAEELFGTEARIIDSLAAASEMVRSASVAAHPDSDSRN